MEAQRAIIITGGGYESEYARKLLALMAEKNIDSALWTEKEYLSNRPQLSNQEKLIFFGLGSETKKQAAIIRNWTFDEFACRIGFLGNICVITAWDGDLQWEDLQAFSTYCKSKAKKHSDIVIPSADATGEVLNVLKGIFSDKDNKSVWRAQFSVLVYEFIDNWLDGLIGSKHEQTK